MVAIPGDLTGKSASDVQAALHKLGFVDVDVYGPNGEPVVLTDGWHVVSVDGAGTNSPTTARITVRVELNPTTTVAPPPPPQATEQAPPPAYTPPVPAPVPSEVYYKNCAAARAAGAAPLYRGQPGYRAALDRDNDGIACE